MRQRWRRQCGTLWKRIRSSMCQKILWWSIRNKIAVACLKRGFLMSHVAYLACPSKLGAYTSLTYFWHIAKMFRPQTVICRVIGFTSCSVLFYMLQGASCYVHSRMFLGNFKVYFGFLSHQLLNSSGSGFMGLKLAPQSADGSFSLVVSALVTGKFSTWPSWNDFVMFHPKDPKGMDSSRGIIIPECLDLLCCFVFLTVPACFVLLRLLMWDPRWAPKKKNWSSCVWVYHSDFCWFHSYFWDQVAGHVCVGVINI